MVVFSKIFSSLWRWNKSKDKKTSFKSIELREKAISEDDEDDNHTNDYKTLHSSGTDKSKTNPFSSDLSTISFADSSKLVADNENATNSHELKSAESEESSKYSDEQSIIEPLASSENTSEKESDIPLSRFTSTNRQSIKRPKSSYKDDLESNSTTADPNQSENHNIIVVAAKRVKCTQTNDETDENIATISSTLLIKLLVPMELTISMNSDKEDVTVKAKFSQV